MHVTFLPGGKRVETDGKETILDAARKAGIALPSACGGHGLCGKCKVRIEGAYKTKAMADQQGVCLACRTYALSDVTVHAPETAGVSKILAELDRFESIEPVGAGLGLAVDLGTTTIVASLVDLKTGDVIASASDYNRQMQYGDDVLSRILHAKKDLAGLRDAATGTIKSLVGRMNAEDASHVIVSGNTTMIYLLLGMDPEPIRKNDFPETRFSERDGNAIGLRAGTKLRCVPGVSAYVGGDVVSDIIASGMDRNKETTLLVDVGTNGEVVVGNKDWMMACAASAGPAFEGGEVSCGARAVDGAIEMVKLRNDAFDVRTIGGKMPTGICGSGLIDLVAELFTNGIVDRAGNVNASPVVCNKSVIVADGIAVHQDEIKSIIRSKAAIYAAITTLMRKAEISFDDLHAIIVCGGFGHYLNATNAKAIGMFPDVDDSKFQFMGNASLKGAIKMLLDKKLIARSEELSRSVTYVNLSSDTDFMDEYTAALFLPHTDASRFRSSA